MTQSRGGGAAGVYGDFAPTQAWQPSSASPQQQQPAQLPLHPPLAPASSPAPPTAANLLTPINQQTSEQQRPLHSTQSLAAGAPPGAQVAEPAAVQIQAGRGGEGQGWQQGMSEQDLGPRHSVQPSVAEPDNLRSGKEKDAGLATQQQLTPAAPRPLGSASGEPQLLHQRQADHQPPVPLVAPCAGVSGGQRRQQWAGGQPHVPPCVSGPGSAAAPRLRQQQSRLSVSTAAVCAGTAALQPSGNQNFRPQSSGLCAEVLSPAPRPSRAEVSTTVSLEAAQETGLSLQDTGSAS